jgi:hypothetical protein
MKLRTHTAYLEVPLLPTATDASTTAAGECNSGTALRTSQASAGGKGRCCLTEPSPAGLVDGPPDADAALSPSMARLESFDSAPSAISPALRT